MEKLNKEPLKVQNRFNFHTFESIIKDNKKYAEGDINIGDYFLQDYDASPESWNVCFRLTYDEISEAAKINRRKIIHKALIEIGHNPTEKLEVVRRAKGAGRKKKYGVETVYKGYRCPINRAEELDTVVNNLLKKWKK